MDEVFYSKCALSLHFMILISQHSDPHSHLTPSPTLSGTRSHVILYMQLTS